MSYYFRRFRQFLRTHETVKSLLLIAVIILGALAFWEGFRLALNTEYSMLVVSSGSMCPPTNCVLPVGALIVIHGQDPGKVGLGSIIVFRSYPDEADYLIFIESSLFSHRTMEVSILASSLSGLTEMQIRTAMINGESLI